MRNKKGFTLVEIILCLVLIALVSAISVISILKKDNNIDEEDKQEFENAVNIISEVLETKDVLKSYVETKQEEDKTTITSFYCFTKETLIDTGIIDEENEILKKINDGKYIKVAKDDLGEYTILYNSEEDDCKYYIANIETITGEEDVEYEGGTEDDSYAIKEKFQQVNDNQFQMQITFTKDVYQEEISPLYVLFILDTSGSMRSNDRYGKAKQAIKDFGKDILENTVNSKIGFLPFAEDANPVLFGSSYWTTDLTRFQSSVNSVIYKFDNYYNEAYYEVINTYRINRLEEDAIVYIVMFSDAGDAPTCYTTSNKNAVVNTIAPHVNKIIFIAYNPGNVYCLNNISNAVNSIYPNRSQHLFSNNSDVESILEGVSNTIKEETKYRNAKIKMEIDKEYFSVVVDDTWDYDEHTNTITKLIDFTNLEIDVLETVLTFDILYNAKSNINSFTDDIAIIKSFELEFEKKDGTKEIIELDTSKLPVTKITTTEKSVIN